MQIQSHDTNAKRYGIALAGVALAVLLAIGLATTATAAPVGDSPLNVTLEDPANEQIDVTLDFAAATDATVDLTDGDVIYDTTTITGSAGGTQTLTLGTGAADAGDYQIALDSPDATNVTVNQTAITKTVDVNVTDAANETVVVDAVFAGGQNASTTVTMTDSTGATVVTDTIDYLDSQHDSGATLTREYNASDGVVADNLTVAIATSPAAAYEAAYAQLGGDTTGGLLGGTIAGQDSSVVLAMIVLLGGGYYARREEWI